MSSILLVSTLGGILFAVVRSPYMTEQNVTVGQPVAFSHQHHVADIGMDCRYCHQTVEVSAKAGIPSTQVCMNCHRDLWNQADMLAPVRDSYRESQPMEWNRVHDLPDYVYFNHSIHIHSGIGCYSCHGDISEMALVRREHPLTMAWCLDCHRNPEKNVRPKEFIYVTKPLEELMDKTPFVKPTVAGSESADSDIAEKTGTSDERSHDSYTVEELRRLLAEENHLKSKMDCYTCHR